MRRARGAIIAISGLDGAGKSTQVEAMRAALVADGHDAVVLWQRISYSRTLQWLTAPLRIILRWVMRRRPDIVPPPPADPEAWVEQPEHLATRALRERLPLVSALWITLVTLVHATAVRRETLRQTRRGRIVLRDRYLLDSIVHLQDKYGRTQDVRRQAWLLRRLIPAPTAAFFIDVSAEEARRRKPEEYTVDELDSHRQAYLRLAPELGVRVVDGHGAVQEITRRIADDVRSRVAAAPVRSDP